MCKQPNPVRPALLAVTLALLPFLTGCKDESVRAYQVPKERAARAQSSPHGTERPAAPTAHVHWESLPANWQERPVSGVMRAAEIGIQGEAGQTAELAVFALPEVRGMELEFVNMWREQISLGATTTAAIADLREAVTIAGNPGQLFDMAGGQPTTADGTIQRIVVAMFTAEGTTWFFKLTGPDALVAGEKDNLKRVLENVDVHSEPHGAPPSAMAAAPASSPPPASADLPTWTVPPGWTATAPGMMVAAKFDVAGGQAQVTVSTAGGDLLSNVNRWRGQLGLAPVAAGQLAEVASEIEVSTGKATLVDLASDDRRMLTVIVPHQGQSWFYKLLGGPSAVAEAKDAFLQFAKSAQY